MATYKVPQDVEAEDKLIGPLSLKQFIFAILFFASAYVTYLFTQIPPKPIFGVVGLPFLIVFGVLAFYQRKDQPVEVYLLAWLNYHIKPKKRVWDQGGYEERVIITVPKVEEIDYTKGLTQKDIEQKTKRFSQIIDTRGWVAKGITATSTGLAGDKRIMTSDEIAQINGRSELTPPGLTDLYEKSPVANSVDSLIQTHAEARQQNLKLSIDEARRQVSANEINNPITGQVYNNNTSPVSSPQISQQQIQNLANNDLLPISEIAKKASEINNSEEVEIKLN
ncbi:MAG TPA: PrgI family protein [Candidatus Saccharibacteria bacterium]|nr:PrgI family protein [Candidatus Saccharibacteria bacterium]